MFEVTKSKQLINLTVFLMVLAVLTAGCSTLSPPSIDSEGNKCYSDITKIHTKAFKWVAREDAHGNTIMCVDGYEDL